MKGNLNKANLTNTGNSANSYLPDTSRPVQRHMLPQTRTNQPGSLFSSPENERQLVLFLFLRELP